MTTQASRHLISVADVASAYNVSVSTIYRRIREGNLQAYKMGPRSIRLDAAEVAEAFRA